MNLHRSVLALVIISVLGTQALTYWFTRDVLLSSANQRETEKVDTLANVVGSLIAEYAQGARLAARVLSTSTGIIETLSDRSGDYTQVFEKTFQRVLADNRMDILELVDRDLRVRLHAAAEQPGEDWSQAWGVSEALQGMDSLVSHATQTGAAVIAIEPVRMGDEVIGAVLAGRHLGDAFIHELSHKVNADLALVSRSGVLASSSETALGALDADAIDEAFHEKIPIYRDAREGYAKLVYLPLVIVDEAFVVMLRVDSSKTFQALEENFLEIVSWTAGILAVILVVAFLVLRVVLRPLARLRERAEKTGLALGGIDLETRARDEISAVVQVLDAVTERLLEQNRALSEARKEAELASEAKSQFLSNMSHEIRTPLSGMLGMASLLEGTELSPTQRRYCSTINASGRSLFDLLSDILDFSKIEAGKVAVESIAFDLRALLEDVVRISGEIAATRSNRLIAHIDPPPASWVQGDPVRLRQVLSNLLSNANKFTANGEITLTVSQCEAPAEDQRQWLRFSVRDTGVGFSADKLPILFRPFSQADGSTTRQFGGSGLGLVISRHLVELMGGAIHAEGVSGEGAHFWFDLPLCAAQEADRAESEDDSPATDLRGVRLLLAEDHPVNCEVLSVTLRNSGATVQTAGNGALAVEAFRQHDFDLVLMDCQMPVMSGYEAASQIRAEEQPGQRVPIIAVTANAFAEDRERCLAAGMDDFLTKPVDSAVLLRVVSRWARRSRNGKAQEDAVAPAGRPSRAMPGAGDAARPELPAGGGPQHPPDTRSRSTVVVDCERLHSLREIGGNQLVERTLRLFAQTTNDKLAELRPALEAADLERLASGAHFLKGSAANLGLVAFADAAASLEARARAGDAAVAEDFEALMQSALRTTLNALEEAGFAFALDYQG